MQSLYWPKLGHPLPRCRGVHNPGMIANDYPALAFMDGMSQVDDV